MFKSAFLKKTIVIAIIFTFQFPVFTQAISRNIEVKTENLPRVLIDEEIEANIAGRQNNHVSSGKAQLYFTISSVDNIIEENSFLHIILEEVNKQRLANSLPVLVLNPQLNKAAELKAADMVKNGYFAHNSPAGLTSWHWFDEAGYDFAYAGENLAVDFNSPKDIVQAWMNSPSHQQNILNDHFNETGLAVMKGNYNNNSSLFVVQMFGQSRIKVNDFIDTDIMVNSGEQSINLVHAVVHYPADKLMFNAIDFDDSAFSLFFKEIDTEKGIVTILAIQPFPGIKGIAKIGHLQFKALKKDDINLSWGNDSSVLANDGLGTNILSDAMNISYRIK